MKAITPLLEEKKVSHFLREADQGWVVIVESQDQANLVVSLLITEGYVVRGIDFSLSSHRCWKIFVESPEL
jgi:hypothetical protein